MWLYDKLVTAGPERLILLEPLLMALPLITRFLPDKFVPYTAAKVLEVLIVTGALIIQFNKLSLDAVPANSTTLPLVEEVAAIVRFLKMIFMELSNLSV